VFTDERSKGFYSKKGGEEGKERAKEKEKVLMNRERKTRL